MTRRIYKEDLAELDLLEPIDYLQSQASLEVALRFIDAVEEVFAYLAEWPQIRVRRKFSNNRLHEIRMWPIPDFPKFLIFYQYLDDEIRVLRILYGTRNIPPLFEDA